MSFARCCFEYALDTRQDFWFSTKDTISKDYDQTFKADFRSKVYRRGVPRSPLRQAGLALPLHPH